MTRFLLWLFRCSWLGHTDGSGFPWPHLNEDTILVQGIAYKATKCVYCDKVLNYAPVKRQHMRIKVDILEDTDGMSGM